MDSDGDGVGDLAGITSKLDHVNAVAGTVWLSPIYSSPQRDFGYDVSNFTDINPEYGTLEDFDELVAKAKSLGLRVLLDFVPNHSSDEHEWFKKSIQRIKPYDDYYVWRDGRVGGNGVRLPPNNWLSAFTGSAWEWNNERGQYYLHQFLTSQPDLNYRNPNVQREMEEVLKFWLDRGVDGFRIDAIALLVEDAQLRDEPRSKNDVPPDDYDFLEHVYTRNLPETYDIVQSWKWLMDKYSREHGTDEKLALMEVGGELPFVMKYYHIGVDPFNFQFLGDINNRSTPRDFGRGILTWMKFMPRGKIANWVIGNHDVHRVATRFGHHRADQMSMLSVVLPGMMVIYNGDEIGMLDRYFTYEETIDPAGCNAGPERYSMKSRDPERTPYQWDDTVSAGFSTNPKTWLPVNGNYKTLNLALQKTVEDSHYKVFQTLTKLKKLPIIEKGNLQILVSTKVLAVTRRLSGEDPVVLLINFDDNLVELNVSAWARIPEEMFIYVASVQSGLKSGDILNTTKLSIPGSATIILTPRKLVTTALNIV